MSTQFLTFVFVLFANLWIWKIFSFNFLLGILVLTTSFLFYFSLRVGKSKNPLLFLSFLALLIFQFRTTEVSSLTNLDNDQKRIQQMRLNEYPPVSIKVGRKTLWIPIAHWFEGRKETIAAFRIQKNFSQIFDPMLYFFANHPRERVGINEFEKFPYILLPFFLVGIFSLSKKFKSKIFLALFFPLVLIVIIGNKNPLGPFSLFPFICLVTWEGLFQAKQKIKKLPRKWGRRVLTFFFVVFVLIFLQIVAYAKY